MSSRIDFFYHAFRNVLLVSVPLLIFSIFVFTIPHSSAEISSGADNIQLVLSTSCTINAIVTSEHTVSLNGGQLDNNVGNTKLSAYCNDNNGYSIYAIGSSGDVDGNTDLIYNNGLSDSYNIRTGVYDSSNIVNPSSWAMKLTAGTGTGIDPVTGESVLTTPPTILNGYDNYSAIPNVYTQVAKRTSGTSMTTDTSVSGSYLNTTYQIYANSAQPAGTYNGKVKYIILHPGTDAPSTINDIDAAFAMTGKQKYPQESGAYYAMQDMTTDICNSVSRNGEITSTQLVDLRDNKLYWVTKLKDGHCWMTQNLDLDLGVKDATLGIDTTVFTSEDTDLNDNSLMGAYKDGYKYENGVLSWTPQNTTYSYQDKTGTKWKNDNNMAYSLDPGIWYWNANDNTPNCNYLTTACEDFAQTPYSNNGTHGAEGNYYNWSAAIASDDSSSFMSNTYVDTTKNPQNSICPKGWRLPVISSQDANEFTKLNNLYNRDNIDSDVGWIDAPLYFTRSGNIDGGPLYSAGSGGSNWSSTVSDYMSTYYLYFGKNTVDLAGRYGSGRTHGRSIRCLSR